MTTEITRATAHYTFRVNPSNRRLIDRKPNRARARWQAWRLFATEEEAARSLYRISAEAPESDKSP